MFKKKYKNKDFDPKFNPNMISKKVLREEEKEWKKELRKKNGGDFFKNWMEKGYDYNPWLWFDLATYVLILYGLVSLFLDFRGWIL